MVTSTEKICIDENESNNDCNWISLSEEDISSVINESVKLNPNLKTSQWAVINTDNISDGFKNVEIHASRIQNIRDLLQNDSTNKIILVWEKSEEELCNEKKYDFAYELHRLRTYPNFRYISHKKLLDKEYMKNLYTKQEKKDIEIENDDMYWYKRLKNIVIPYLMILSKYPEFSFDYKYEWWNSDLDISLQYITKEVSWYCPWFLRSYNQVDDILRFFKNYLPNLIHPNEIKYVINKLATPIERAKKKEFSDSKMLTRLKNITKDLSETIREECNSLESLYQAKPSIKEQVNKTPELMKIYKEIKSEYPWMFYSLDDLLSFYENIKLKMVYYKKLDQYYEQLRQKWCDIEYKRQLRWPALSWVYCDIDWTLVKTKMWWEQDYEVNKKVAKKLIEYYKEWKKITLWSSWTLAKKQKWLANPRLIKQFEEVWLTKPIMKDMWIIDIVGDKVYFKVNNKYLYRFSVPEIVIDDRDRNRFMFHMCIYPKTFINVNDLE